MGLEGAGRGLVFIALVLYSASLAAGALTGLGACGAAAFCRAFAGIASLSSLLLGLVAALIYSLYGCPVLLPALAVGVAASPLLGPYSLPAAALAGLAASMLARRGMIGSCGRGLLATLGVALLAPALAGQAARLPPLEVLPLDRLGALLHAVSLHVRLPPSLWHVAARLRELVLGAPAAPLGLGLVAAAASPPAGVVMLLAGVLDAAVGGLLGAAAGSLLALMGSAAVLAQGAEEEGTAILAPERPAGRVEPVTSTHAPRRSRAQGRAAGPAAAPAAAVQGGGGDRCRGRRLHEFVAAVRGAPGEKWRRFFEECLRGRSVYGYRIEGFLGVGADGAVFRASDEDTGALAALKMILPEPVVEEAEDTRRSITKALQLIESLEREGASLRELSSKSPYIVRVKAVHTDAEKFRLAIRRDSFDIYIKNPPSIIMEYMAGGSAEKLIERAEPGSQAWGRVVASLVAAAASALRVVHENGYVHNDVKPANILLSAPLPGSSAAAAEELTRALREPTRARVVPKLSDLGVASRRGEVVKGFTPLYAAPELILYEAECLSGKGSADICSRPLLAEPSQDVYSLGVVALQLYTGAGKKLLSSYMRLVQENPSIARKLLEGKAPREAVEMIVRMLSLSPGERPSAAEVERLFRRLALGVTRG